MVISDQKRKKKMEIWSELPPDILHLISLKIGNPFNLIHFRSVCSSWRSFSIKKFRHMRSFKCPLLHDSFRSYVVDDCRILSSRVYLIKSPNSPNSQYWLIKLQEKENGEIILCNYLSTRYSFKRGFSYPSVLVDFLNCQIFELAQEYVACHTELCEQFQSLVECQEGLLGFMGLNTKNNKFMILGKFASESLSIYKSADERWIEIEMKPDSYFEGIVSFKGKFYAIDHDGRTIVVEPNLEVKTFQQSRPCDKIKKRWLVESKDKLLLVEMCNEIKYNSHFPNIGRKDTAWFEISKLDEKRNEWDQVEDYVLDGQVLFLDCSCSFLCLATEIPGFRANSIIFFNIWNPSVLNEHERVLVYEFDGQGVKFLRDIPEYIGLFLSPIGRVISNG